MSVKQTSRRDFLKAAATTAGASVLATSGIQAIAKSADAAAPAAVRASAMESSGVLWGLQYDPHVAAYNRLAALFKKEHGMTIKVQPQAWPLDTKMIAAIAAGTQPDVACLLGSLSWHCISIRSWSPCRTLSSSSTRLIPSKVPRGRRPGIQLGRRHSGRAGGEQSSRLHGQCANRGRAGCRTKQNEPAHEWRTYFDSYDTMWSVAKALQTKRGSKVRRWGMSSEGWEAGSLFGIMRSLGANGGTWMPRSLTSRPRQGSRRCRYWWRRP